MAVAALLEKLWTDYSAMTPEAPRILELLRERGEKVRTDHIALRTFAHPAVDIEVLDRAFVAAGYEPADSYEFPDDKLHACHYEHESASLPKIFITTLLLDECSRRLRDTVGALVATLEPGVGAHPLFAASGRRWPLDAATYERLRAESEYAAWVAAFGFRASHFAFDASDLASFDGLSDLSELLVDRGFSLNEVGGRIKGSREQHLEQVATLAHEQILELAPEDPSMAVPACYVELVRRYPLADGRLFQGFVAPSARSLYESTSGHGGRARRPE